MRFGPRHLIVAAAAACTLLAILDFRWLDTYRYNIAAPDFYVYYRAAQIGLAQGWAAIYDPAIFEPAVSAVAGRPLPYLNPPELAWLVIPLSLLPYPLAASIWKVVLALAAGISWWLAAPPGRLTRTLHGLAGAVSLPVFISFFFGQVTLLIVMTVALSWWLIRRQRPWLAGAVLACLILKPQMAFLIPLALLIAGYGRVFLGWLLTTVTLAFAALMATGFSAFDNVARSLATINGVPGPVQISLERQLPLALAIPAIVLALALSAFVLARRHHEDPSVPVAVGLIASILVSPYINFYDIAGAVLATWLIARPGLTSWQRPALALLYLALYLTPLWPIFAPVALALALLIVVAMRSSIGRDAKSTPLAA